ncbi:MAG: DUF1501 domain-containing protein [Gemmataceae bacterium]
MPRLDGQGNGSRSPPECRALLGTPQKFKQHGKGGAWVSEVLPGIASIADELCFVKSMWTEQFNHAPAELLLYTGSQPGPPVDGVVGDLRPRQ